jgi:hypothetical protein
MKKLIKTIVFLGSLLLLLTSSSCDNDDIETGDERFSCYINGQLFVPKAKVNLLGTLPQQNNLSFGRNSSFLIRAANQDYGIFFNIENFDLGEFNLSTSDENNFNYELSHIIISTVDKTYLSKENSGTVTFTAVSDTNVEGIFEFTLYNKNDETDIIKVTKGKFND